MDITKDTPVTTLDVKRLSPTELEIHTTRIYSKDYGVGLNTALLHPYYREDKVEPLYSVGMLSDLNIPKKRARIGSIEIDIEGVTTTKFMGECLNIVRLRKTIVAECQDKLDTIENDCRVLNTAPEICLPGIVDYKNSSHYPTGGSFVCYIEDGETCDLVAMKVGDLVA